MSRRATPADTSARWHVDLRTAQRWHAGRSKHHPPPAALAAGEPGARAMLAWFASLPSAIQSKLSRPFRAEIDRLRIAIERSLPLYDPSPHASPPAAPGAAPHGASAPPPPGGNPRGGSAGTHSQDHRAGGAPNTSSSPILDPDYAAFLREYHATTDPTNPASTAAPRDKTLLADLKLQAAYAVFQLQRAQTTGRLDRVKDALETIRHLSGVIHDEELRAQKLGREAGDILPRAEATRLLRALPYWLLRSTDDLLATLSRLLAAATAAPLYPAAVRALLEPHLLAARVLTPLARAAQINAGTTLPDWALAAMRESLAATLEDGATLFDTLYATPVPSHPIQPSPSPILQVTTGPSSAGPSAVEAPSDHGPAALKPAGEATASHSPPGSVPPQTA